MTATTYHVVRDHRLSELMVSINKALNDGWKLAGGIAVTTSMGNQEIYCQAITLTTRTKPHRPAAKGGRGK